jgi:hypothetical protein
MKMPKMPKMPKLKAPSEKMIFGLMIVGGYILQMGTLAFFTVPDGNLQLFAQGIGTLGTAVGVIVAAIYKNSAQEQQNSDTMKTLAEKVTPTPPAAGTAAVTPGEGVTVAAIEGDPSPASEPEPR